jgi:hypothetical protein
MKVSVHLFLVTILLMSCVTHNQIHNKNSKNFKVESSNCFSKYDSTFSDGDFIRYVKRDTTIDVEIKINNQTTFLNLNISCNWINDLLPILYYHKKNAIILQRGYGTSLRELFISEYISNKICTSRFETELTLNANSDVFVYKYASEKSKLYISERIKKDKTNDCLSQTFDLPEKYWDLTIANTTVFEKYIELHFTNGQEHTILTAK